MQETMQETIICNRWIILDCNAAIIGSKKGYKTFKGAKRKEKVEWFNIMAKYYERDNKENNLISQIIPVHVITQGVGKTKRVVYEKRTGYIVRNNGGQDNAC